MSIFLAVPSHDCGVMSFASKQFIEGVFPFEFWVRSREVWSHSITLMEYGGLPTGLLGPFTSRVLLGCNAGSTWEYADG
jgi:hypothetical protein